MGHAEGLTGPEVNGVKPCPDLPDEPPAIIRSASLSRPSFCVVAVLSRHHPFALAVSHVADAPPLPAPMYITYFLSDFLRFFTVVFLCLVRSTQTRSLTTVKRQQYAI